MTVEAEPHRALVDPEVRAELPGLELWTLAARGADGRSTRALRARLKELAGRWTGARAIAVRSQPVAHAYRVAFRQLGLDPDEERPPLEAAVLRRLEKGGFPSRGRLRDALLLALLDTGVGVWTLDAAAVEGELALRQARHGERLGEGELAPDLPEGRLVVADDRGPAAVLFGRVADDRVPTQETEGVVLFAVRVEGVPELHVEEALFRAADDLA
ncbi:hypothetical protein [Conexibacter sp. SYSU D00693]|uniref:hypothetical protein n=1 Tax=Conexibacter sp. SYSU D00693 TaxID=2812560 RepID=UPI00196A6A88|nr:hypothetical protein [Conexibacter sp. SYSU D00693]